VAIRPADRPETREPRPLQDRPAAISAYDLLRSEILSGPLQPGERLRAADLRTRYGLGLTPIREALTRLASEGLVVMEAHRGARVREASLDDLSDLMRTRREIEALCLGHSISQGDADWEAEILRTLHLLTRAELPASPADRATAEAWEARHRAFHAALVAACGSGWLLRFWHELADHSERYRKMRLLNYRTLAADVRDVNAEHHAIARAALDRDAKTAARLMNDHIGRTEAAVARLLKEGGT
jgi:DNA-binding GntR family transcriptional regulator